MESLCFFQLVALNVIFILDVGSFEDTRFQKTWKYEKEKDVLKRKGSKYKSNHIKYVRKIICKIYVAREYV